MARELRWEAVGAAAGIAGVLVAILAWLDPRGSQDPNALSGNAATTSTAASAAPGPAESTTTDAPPPDSPSASFPDTPVALANPCDLPSASVVRRFDMKNGSDSVDNSTGDEISTCGWSSAHPLGWLQNYVLTAQYATNGGAPFSAMTNGWTPISVSGISSAYQRYTDETGECDILWPASFGSVQVTALQSTNFTTPTDQTTCILAAQFAASLAADVPN